VPISRRSDSKGDLFSQQGISFFSGGGWDKHWGGGGGEMLNMSSRALPWVVWRAGAYAININKYGLLGGGGGPHAQIRMAQKVRGAAYGARPKGLIKKKIFFSPRNKIWPRYSPRAYATTLWAGENPPSRARRAGPTRRTL